MAGSNLERVLKFRNFLNHTCHQFLKPFIARSPIQPWEGGWKFGIFKQIIFSYRYENIMYINIYENCLSTNWIPYIALGLKVLFDFSCLLLVTHTKRNKSLYNIARVWSISAIFEFSCIYQFLLMRSQPLNASPIFQQFCQHNKIGLLQLIIKNILLQLQIVYSGTDTKWLQYQLNVSLTVSFKTDDLSIFFL